MSAEQSHTEETAEVIEARRLPKDLSLQLNRPAFWSPAFKSIMLLLGVLAVGYGLVVVQVLGAVPQAVSIWDYALALLPPMLIPLALFAIRRWRRRAALPPITFRADYVTLPVSLESTRVKDVPYGEVAALDIRGHGAFTRLFVSTKERLFVFPRNAFLDPAGLELAVQSLHGRILAAPNGAENVARMARQRELAALALSNRPLVTHALLAVIFVVFIIEYMTGALSGASYYGLVTMGANVPMLVREGEISRLVSATFLHAGIAHFYLNGLALYYLGGILERLLGWARFALIYGLSGLAGSLGTVLVNQAVSSVGASGAIFGLLGALAVVNWRFRAQLPLGFRQPTRWWMFIAAINILLPLLLPRIDVVAHGAGFVAGAVVALLVLDAGRILDPKAKAGLSMSILAAVLLMFYAAGLSTGMRQGLDADRNDEMTFARQLLRHPQTKPEVLTDAAYRMALDPHAREPDLRIASVAAHKALQAQGDLPHALEAVATVDFRLGEIDAAIVRQGQALELAPLAEKTGAWSRFWRGVLQMQPAGKYATRLGEFLVARLNDDGPLATNVDDLNVNFQLQGAGEAGVDSAARRLLVRVDGNHQGLRIFGVARQSTSEGHRYIGLVQVLLGAERSGVMALKPADPALSMWPEVDDIALAWVDGAGCTECDAMHTDVELWYQDLRVTPLP